MACTKLHQAAMRSGRLEHRRLTHAAGGGRPPSACHAAAGTKSSSQQPSGPADLPIAPFASRRHLLLGLAAAAAALSPPALAAPASGGSQAAAAVRTLQASALEAAAAQAYADRDFDTALGALDELLSREPGSLRWQEMRCDARAGAMHACGYGGAVAARPLSASSNCWGAAPALLLSACSLFQPAVPSAGPRRGWTPKTLEARWPTLMQLWRRCRPAPQTSTARACLQVPGWAKGGCMHTCGL